MNYATIKDVDVANGIGVRVSLFVSGCTHHCKGCFNAETWDFNFGKPYTKETQAHILKSLNHDYIRGLSILGGEPFEEANCLELSKLVSTIKNLYPEKTIWCYTGYNLEKDIFPWIDSGKQSVNELLSKLDILVDGEFILAQKNPRLQFRGSQNQRIIDVQQSIKKNCVILAQGYNQNKKGD